MGGINQPELYPCPYSKAVTCTLEDPCKGCETWAKYMVGEEIPRHLSEKICELPSGILIGSHKGNIVVVVESIKDASDLIGMPIQDIKPTNPMIIKPYPVVRHFEDYTDGQANRRERRKQKRKRK